MGDNIFCFPMFNGDEYDSSMSDEELVEDSVERETPTLD